MSKTTGYILGGLVLVVGAFGIYRLTRKPKATAQFGAGTKPNQYNLDPSNPLSYIQAFGGLLPGVSNLVQQFGKPDQTGTDSQGNYDVHAQADAAWDELDATAEDSGNTDNLFSF